MKIIITNFSSYKYLTTDGDNLREAILPWKNDNTSVISEKVNILDVLSGSGLTEEKLKGLGVENTTLIPFNIKKLYNIAEAGFDTLNLNSDWVLDYNKSNSFKFCPYFYSFKSNGRRFYVLKLNGNPTVLSNYRGVWGFLPLKHGGDQVTNYVPIA